MRLLALLAPIKEMEVSGVVSQAPRHASFWPGSQLSTSPVHPRAWACIVLLKAQHRAIWPPPVHLVPLQPYEGAVRAGSSSRELAR
jgi:hypothetical protein